MRNLLRKLVILGVITLTISSSMVCNVSAADYNIMNKGPTKDDSILFQPLGYSNIFKLAITDEITNKVKVTISVGIIAAGITNTKPEQLITTPTPEATATPTPVQEVVPLPIDYNSDDIRVLSNLTVDELSIALNGTALQNLSNIYINAEKTYGVNALFLVSLSALESNWGKSNRAINDNNLTGYGVGSSSSKGINAYTKEDNLMETARCLSQEYLSEGGKFYTGYSISSINKKYCLNSDNTPNYQWSKDINSIANNLLGKCK